MLESTDERIRLSEGVALATRVQLTISPTNRTTRPTPGRDLVAVSNILEARGCWGRFRDNTNYTTDQRNDVVTRVNITAAPEIQLPAWNGLNSASDEVRTEWERMIEVLTAHEDEHEAIFRSAIRRFQRAVRRGRRLSEDDVATMHNDYRTALDRAQREYDRRTHNGRSEGVRLDDPGANRGVIEG